MKKILFFAVLGALAFTSCSNVDEVGVDVIKKDNQSFVDRFGQINPAQNFNTMRSVTIQSSIVNGAGNYTLRVYDAMPTKANGASLIGKFENLNAGNVSTVKVDVSGVAKNLYFIAEQGNKRVLYTAPVAGKVTAKFDDATDTPVPDALEGTFEIDLDEEVGYFHYAFYQNINSVLSLPGLFNETEDHSAAATDFTLAADEEGQVTLFPMYINERIKDNVGYVIMNENNEIIGEGTIFENTVDEIGDYMKIVTTSNKQEVGAYPNFNEAGLAITNRQSVKSTPIVIEAGVGNKIALTITNTNKYGGFNGETYYSVAAMNPNETPVSVYASIEATETETGATSEVTITTTLGIVGIEDIIDPEYGDNDMNDIMFFTLNPVIEEEPLEEKQSITVAFEDLGAEDDYDFNDVVITVDYTTGQTEATVTLQALGGILPVELFYFPYERPQVRTAVKAGESIFGGELHEAMGYGVRTLINTNGTASPYENIAAADKVAPITATLEVPEDFTVADFGAPFAIEVGGASGQIRITAETEYGEVPQVIVIGKTYMPESIDVEIQAPYYWAWPKEKVGVDKAYTNISKWVADPEDLSFLTDGVVESNLYK